MFTRCETYSVRHSGSSSLQSLPESANLSLLMYLIWLLIVLDICFGLLEIFYVYIFYVK